MLTGLLGVLLLLAIRRGLRTVSSTPDVTTLREDAQTMMAYGLPLYVGSMVTIMLTQYQSSVLAFFKPERKEKDSAPHFPAASNKH